MTFCYYSAADARKTNVCSVSISRYFTRELIMILSSSEGTLIKQKKKGSQYCHFFLFSDILLHTIQKKNKYKVKHKIPLIEVSIVDVMDSDSILTTYSLLKNQFSLTFAVLRHAFKLQWKDHVLVVSATTREENQGW